MSQEFPYLSMVATQVIYDCLHVGTTSTTKQKDTQKPKKLYRVEWDCSYMLLMEIKVNK